MGDQEEALWTSVATLGEGEVEDGEIIDDATASRGLGADFSQGRVGVGTYSDLF